MLLLKLPERFQFQALVIALLFLCFIPAQINAQSNTSIQGQSLDQNGAVISGVKITARNEATGFDRTTLTDSVGRYFLAGLPVGDYQLEAGGRGFQTSSQHVNLRVGDQLKINLLMQPGMPELKVEVSSKTQVSTSGYAVAGAISQHRFRNCL